MAAAFAGCQAEKRASNQEEKTVGLNLSKPQGVGIPLSSEEVVELKMIVQDEDERAALDFLRQLKRKGIEIEQRHCGDPDRLPGLS